MRQQLREDLDKHISAANKLTTDIATLKADHSKEIELVETKHNETLTRINDKFRADLDQQIKRSASIQESLRQEIHELNKALRKTKLDMADLSHKQTIETALLNDLHASSMKTLEDRYEKDIIALKSKSKDKAMKIYKENVQKLKVKHETYALSQSERYNMLCNELSSQKMAHKDEIESLQSIDFSQREKLKEISDIKLLHKDTIALLKQEHVEELKI